MASADHAQATSDAAAQNGGTAAATPNAHQSTPPAKVSQVVATRDSIGVSDGACENVVRAVSTARETLERVPPSPSPTKVPLVREDQARPQLVPSLCPAAS